MKKIILTTTGTIEGAEIEQYIDLISINVVVGTNILSDLGASVTDFLGGISDTYQAKLHRINSVGIKQVKAKALNLGANAVIGIKIDFDEISGKGKSMFMLSIFGTAVRISEIEKIQKDHSSNNTVIVGSNVLEQEYYTQKITNKINSKKLPKEEEWPFLLDSPTKDLGSKLLEMYLKSRHKDENSLRMEEKTLRLNILNYFKNLEEEDAINILYSEIVKNSESITKIIKEINLFSPNKTLDLVSNNQLKIATDCLSIKKNYYTKEDLKLMEEIIESFENLKDLGKIEPVKGLLGKAKEKYICPDGHPNDPNANYCLNAGCGKNIKGLNKEQVDKIKNFKTKTSLLKAIIAGD